MFAGLTWSGREHHRFPATAAAPAAGPNRSAVSDVTPADGEEGEGGVYISPARQQLIGVRTATVGTRDVTTSVRATGTLAYDETRVTQIHTKIAGWIDQLFVDFVGKGVEKGQPLFTIYSPDLVATQNEYLLARNAQAQLAASRFEETRQGASSLLAAARKRLELWDVSEAQIADLERSGEPRKTLTVFAPSSGVVLERNAFSGQYLTPEIAAFKFADLSTIWAVGQVFESDLGQVRVGQPVSVELTNAVGAQPIAGRVSFIYPDIDPATRRVRFRAEIPNPGQVLKPDMFVTIVLQGSVSRTLAVPAEAVIDTGIKQYVIVSRGHGYFEPRLIRTDAPTESYYPVISGLAAGDQVVTSAQFLIDSETNLQAAMQAMADMPGMRSKSTPDAPRNAGRDPAAPAPPTGLTIDVRMEPTPVRVGENTWEVALKDAQGQPVTDASVSVLFFMAAMPSMGMPAMRLTTPLPSNGTGAYRARVQVPLAGQWDVTVTATRGAYRLASKRLPVVVK
jgi:RND family efflux transporter MFP subunit